MLGLVQNLVWIFHKRGGVILQVVTISTELLRFVIDDGWLLDGELVVLFNSCDFFGDYTFVSLSIHLLCECIDLSLEFLAIFIHP